MSKKTSGAKLYYCKSRASRVTWVLPVDSHEPRAKCEMYWFWNGCAFICIYLLHVCTVYRSFPQRPFRRFPNFFSRKMSAKLQKDNEIINRRRNKKGIVYSSRLSYILDEIEFFIIYFRFWVKGNIINVIFILHRDVFFFCNMFNFLSAKTSWHIEISLILIYRYGLCLKFLLTK